MATRETLESREAECSTADQFVALAREALEDPADAEYAKEILEKAELACNMPNEYIATAELAVALENKEQAAELYEEAEDACFEPSELATLGHSMASVLGDKEKGREILERAAEEAKDVADMLTISRYAREDLEDEELAKGLLEKVEGGCKTLEEYKTLARTVMEGMQDRETAEAFYRKAETSCDDAASMLEFTGGILELFEDQDWANETLEEIEGDAQFTKDFIALAGFHKNHGGDAEKVREMMDQARDYAMTGEENVLLAEATWTLLEDKEGAAEAYKKALGEMDDKDQLVALAGKLATDLGSPDLAREAYARYETKLTNAADAARLAKAVCDDLGDKDLAREIYGRAEEKFGEPADALTLAAEILANLEDKDWADRLYRRALDGTSKFGPLGKLLDTAQAGVGSPDLARAILEKIAGAAVTPPEMLNTADKVMEILEDREFATGLLDTAEEGVTSLDEMKKVVGAVEKHLGDDADRLIRVKEKLEKREANQDTYAAFQKEEEALTKFHQYVRLADRVMGELDDRYYAAKLLRMAEEKLGALAFSVPAYARMASAVETHLGDADWVGSILAAAGERARSFGDKRELARRALADLTAEDQAKTWVRGVYEACESDLGGREEATVYDFAKLSSAVREDLGEADWAGKLLGEAENRASDAFSLAHLAGLQAAAGDVGKADGLRRQAILSATSPEQCAQLVGRLTADRMPDAEVRGLYQTYGDTLAEPGVKLRWAESILDLWHDEDWAKRVYREISGAMSSGADKARWEASVQHRFDGKL